MRARYAPRYPFGLTLSEIGAFLSHRAAWRRIVDDGLDYAVVFEDDAAIEPARFAALLDFLAAGAGALVLRPDAGGRARACGRYPQPAGRRDPVRPHSPPLRAIGQVVSREAAERLLAVTAPFDRPVDTFLQMNWITGVALLVALPTPIRDVSRETGGRPCSGSGWVCSRACTTRRCGRSTGRRCSSAIAGALAAGADTKP